MADEKKIAGEIMSDEELDNVAGGTGGQTYNDSKLLYEYGFADTWHTDLHFMFHWGDSAEVDEGWRKAGITCVTKPFKDNQYFMDGKEITMAEARDYLKANFKKIRTID